MTAEKALVRIFIVAALFPYVGIPLGMDTQPWALLASMGGFLLLFRRMVFTGVHWGLFLLATASCLMMVIEGGGFGAIRNAAGYVSLFLLAVMGAHAMRVDREGVAKAIDVSLIIWLAVGLIQRLVWRDAFTILLSAARTTESRGVVGLAPEPTFYASMILLMVLWRATIGLRRWHIGVLVLTVVALASSSQILIVLLIAGGVAAICLLFTRYWWVSAALMACGAAGMFAIVALLQDTRIGELAALAIENPALILARDASANERFVHIFAGLHAAIDFAGMPQGILTAQWTDYVNDIVRRYPHIFWVPQGGDRIMSALGALCFQMGALALPLIIASGAALTTWRAPAGYRMIWAAAFGALVLTALPLGHPLLGAVLGALAYVGHQRIPHSGHASTNARRLPSQSA